MSLRFAYLAVLRVFGWLALLARSDIGEIKTTLMLYAWPAASGGTSQLFNSAAAFAALLNRDPAAAAALTAPEVLVRTSNLPDSRGHSVAGPAGSYAGKCP
jgi:hypothetical protein